MIVCLCKGVSCSTVRRVVGEGAGDLDAVGRACGAGADCGACHAEVEAILRAERAARDSREGSGVRRLPVVSDDRAA